MNALRKSMSWANLRLASSAVVVVGLSACSTTQNYMKVSLPVVVSTSFAECGSNDGSSDVEWIKDGKLLQVFELDWNAHSNGDWAVASYTPLGQTLFQLDFDAKEKKIKQKGQAGDALAPLGGESDILTWDSKALGIRYDEAACFLGQKLPRRWLKKIVSDESTNKFFRYRIVDSGREILATLDKSNRGGISGWKVQVEWSLYWFKKMSLSMDYSSSEQAILIRSEQFAGPELRIASRED